MSKTGRAAVMSEAKKELEIREYPLPEVGSRMHAGQDHLLHHL